MLFTAMLFSKVQACAKMMQTSGGLKTLVGQNGQSGPRILKKWNPTMIKHGRG